ncbi:hypothetical protein [Pseudomonas sp. NFACC39-1]|uniref:hypothetical protein n=1 Tax=Pseudomonas sp. NFACC39-1 TaxID=1566195 RepID=UPI0008B9F311|nr:hypothetical protein [Pseudomonas sp. NFACC39-1]SEO85348.1 hypothetical protein SAMN03159293_04143 [Pseudomonas sp. NFACC39-1]SFH02171.1 hypothetical protein SAMN03159297_02568 [Pseudomonas sp. NFACC45]
MNKFFFAGMLSVAGLPGTVHTVYAASCPSVQEIVATPLPNTSPNDPVGSYEYKVSSSGWSGRAHGDNILLLKGLALESSASNTCVYAVEKTIDQYGNTEKRTLTLTKGS